MKRVSFHKLAEREMNDAALYYEQESAGLGERRFLMKLSELSVRLSSECECRKAGAWASASSHFPIDKTLQKAGYGGTRPFLNCEM
jgi:hypothetical protein